MNFDKYKVSTTSKKQVNSFEKYGKPVGDIQAETTPAEEQDKNIFIRGGNYIGEGIKDFAGNRAIEQAKQGKDMSRADFGTLLASNIAGEAAKTVGNIAGSISKSLVKVPRTLYNLPNYIAGKGTQGEQDLNLPILGKVETYPKMMQQQAKDLEPMFGKYATLAAGGLTALEAVGDVAAIGEGAQFGLKALVSLPKKVGSPNVKELNKAVRPGAMKAENLERWNKNIKIASEATARQLKENALTKEGVQKVSSLDNLYDLAKQTKTNIWNTVKKLGQESGKEIAILGDDIAKALDDVITPEITRENPAILKRLEELKSAYRGSSLDVAEAESILESKNAALQSYYANRGNASAKYKTDWELRADEIIARKLREGLNNAIEGYSGLKKEYGALVEFTDKVSRRVGTLKGQEGNTNLVQQYSWVEGVGRAARDLGNGDYVDAATELLRIPTANALKYLNSADFHATKAFQDLDKSGMFDTLIRFLNKANIEGGEKATEWLRNIKIPAGLSLEDVTGNKFQNPLSTKSRMG